MKKILLVISFRLIFSPIFIYCYRIIQQWELFNYEHINCFDDILSKQLTEYNQDKYNKTFIFNKQFMFIPLCTSGTYQHHKI